MSGGVGSDTDGSFDDDLLEIRARCKELTKEKDMLRDSKSQSFELIRKLECHVRTLSEAGEEDKKRIQELERELSNCCQEIDYLQDLLNTRNSDLNCLGEEICGLQFELSNMENLKDEVIQLREQMKISDSEQLLLLQEVEDKEVLIRNSASCVKKLEETLASMGLEYQCEIESTKLELIASEQNFFETKKLLEQRSQQNSWMNELIWDLQIQLQDADKVIKKLEEDNKDLKEKLETSDLNTHAFAEKVEEKVNKSLQKNDCQTSHENDTRLSLSGLSDVESNKMAELTRQIDEYELLVRQLKEELRTERLKSKEEAEDLAQEMAELRYEITGLLEDECKRRACIEQISLQRIAELEAQIAKEQQKSNTSQSLVVRNIDGT